MNLDGLNKWLTLIANVGVLIGIIFLSMEISQSNRIAEREGRSELVLNEIYLQSTFVTDSEVAALMVKLSDKSAELSPTEMFRADSLAQQIFLSMANINISFESGFLEGAPLERQIRGTLQSIERAPGLAPYVARAMERFGASQRGSNPIFDRIWETIESVE